MYKINTTLLIIFLIMIALFVYKTVRIPETATISINTQSQQDNTGSNVYGEEFEQRLHDYIMAHPEVLVESIENMQKKKYENSSRQEADYLAQNKASIEGEGAPPVLGNSDGDITIVAFYDYNCSFCKKGNNFVNQVIERDPRVKVVLRPIPILGDASVYAAKVALAVHKVSPEKFLLIHNEMMKMESVAEQDIKSLLAANNIDYTIVENEINSFGLKQLINKNFDLAKNIGVKGAPSYIINGIFIPGMIDTEKFMGIIRELRQISDAAGRQDKGGQDKNAAPAADQSTSKDEPVSDSQDDPAKK